MELVTFSTLWQEDCALRRRYEIRPRLHRNALRCELRRRKIRHQPQPDGTCLWDLTQFLDTFVQLYERSAAICSRRSRSSIARCYMAATPQELASQNWLPRAAAAKAAGIRPDRLSPWVVSMKILPRWDAAHHRLLYPVDTARALSPWRPMHFIIKHCTPEQIDHIRRHRRKKPMFRYGQPIGALYHVPELSHL